MILAHRKYSKTILKTDTYMGDNLTYFFVYSTQPSGYGYRLAIRRRIRYRMSKSQPINRQQCQPDIYEIRIQGHLHKRREEQFEGLTITRQSDGSTTLIGPLPDQTALHGILLRIRNMNLKLISVNQIEMNSDAIEG